MIEINNKTNHKINVKKLTAVISRFIVFYKLKDFSVSVAFVGDKAMREANSVYRSLDKPTDVLSFPKLNEILIDYAQIRRQARELKKKTEDELIFILVHGLLHLIGRRDHTEKLRLEMIAEGEAFLKKM
jgi:probable rRNA maturation factor